MNNKKIHILIQQTKAFPHNNNSFSFFYTQLIDWLNDKGYDAKLYYSYIGLNDIGYENGLFLPDKTPGFYSEKNIKAISSFIYENDINIILDYSHTITGNIQRYYREIRKIFPKIFIATMIHSCPNHTVQLISFKIQQLKWKNCNNLKKKIQYLIPEIYLYLLQKKINRDNKIIYKNMDEVILLSSSYIPEFKKMIGNQDAGYISAIPNTIRPFKAEITPEDKEKEILWVGRLSKEKAVEKILGIWKAVAEELKDWRFTIVGDGDEKQSLEQLCKEQHIPRVNFTGRQEAIPYIERAAVICLTSVIEGLPTVFIEAMMMGTVPIGYATYSAINDLIDNNENGYIINNNDSECFQQKLLLLCKNNNLRIKMAYNALKKAENFKIDNIAPLWENLFKKHHII